MEKKSMKAKFWLRLNIDLSYFERGMLLAFLVGVAYALTSGITAFFLSAVCFAGAVAVALAIPWYVTILLAAGAYAATVYIAYQSKVRNIDMSRPTVGARVFLAMFSMALIGLLAPLFWALRA